MKNRVSQNKDHYISLVEAVAWNNTSNQITQPVFSSQGLRFSPGKNQPEQPGIKKDKLITKARNRNKTNFVISW